MRDDSSIARVRSTRGIIFVIVFKLVTRARNATCTRIDRFLASTMCRLAGLRANFILISGRGAGRIHGAYRLPLKRYLLMLSRNCLRFRDSHGGPHGFYYEIGSRNGETSTHFFSYFWRADKRRGVTCTESTFLFEINSVIVLVIATVEKAYGEKFSLFLAWRKLLNVGFTILLSDVNS